MIKKVLTSQPYVMSEAVIDDDDALQCPNRNNANDVGYLGYIVTDDGSYVILQKVLSKKRRNTS